VSDAHPANQRFALGDPYAELAPVILLFLVPLSLWTLLPNLGEFPSGRFWGAAAWSTFIIVSYPVLRAWILLPRRLYAEFTAAELVVKSSEFTLTATYSNIQGVSPHDPTWRRTLAALRALLGLRPLRPCIRVDLREPIPRPLIGRTRRLLLRPRDTALFLQTLQQRAPATPIAI
jgi:hypothetical protein